MGGYLVNMLNIAEKDFVIEVLNATDGYWVGATDEGHEGNWTTFDAGQHVLWKTLKQKIREIFTLELGIN